ncbi:serine carboxypeptidase s28 domain-containing protein [Ditylenchus destructor]|uniref:Serine carboxypeptidase s28 domain-containing protein n=1 Tax=Ditylenchus destructor TaxID=166010 RepID=A0AAD4MR06_9BILA|nr:serine carboxypeptidase s28 domain-containing protein [Ditylenchus destructor]
MLVARFLSSVSSSLFRKTFRGKKSSLATVWCLEHRFYGSSQPFLANTRNNLGYLSSRQAVEDIKNFINAQSLATRNAKWVIVGGSYAGALALWVRQKYPSMSVGAVSSSPVVIPTTDFYSLSLRNELQYEEGVDRLNEHLKLKPPLDGYRSDYKSFQNLHHNIMKLFEIPVEYNKVNVGPFATKAGIDDVCKIMSNETVKDIDRVIQWAKYLYTAVYGHPDNFPGIPNRYEYLLADLRNISLADSNKAGTRSWFWQQCTEFGQFITTDNSQGLFSASVPNDYFIGLCSEVFYRSQTLFTATNLTNNVKETVNYFGATNVYKGKNAFIISAQSDPWISLAPNVTTDSSSAVYIVQGAGHNAFLQPPTSTDPVTLKLARTLVTNKVKSWLKNSNKANQVVKSDHQTNEEDINEHLEVNQFVGYNGEWPKIKSWEAVIVHDPVPGLELEDGASENEIPYSLKQVTTLTDVLRKYLTLNQAKNNTPGVEPRYLNTSYIIQDVDHFDPTNTLKFSQKYLTNDVHQRDKDAPRFLMLGGEDSINWKYVSGEAFAYYYWGDDFKAVLYALEHRYFGYSMPFSNISVNSLRWLTAEQAVADAAVFVNAINQKNNLTDPRWVVFGGSYAGNLAAIFRLRYPELSLGAIASSAPLQARTDFFEYMQAVEKDLKKYAPEGCPGAVRRYFAWIRKKMNTRVGRKEAKAAFCVLNNWDENYVDEKDVELLLTEKVFWIDRDHWYLEYLCRQVKRFDDEHGAEKADRARELYETMRNISTHLGIPDSLGVGRAMGHNAKFISADGGDGNYEGYDDDSGDKDSDEDSGSPEEECYCYWCEWVSYDQQIEALQDIYSRRTRGYYNKDRLWFWLTCTQWGFAISTNYGYNYFESSLPINHLLDICYDVFGPEFTRARVEGGVRHMNYLFGGQDNFNGTNVVFVNGSEDPWSALSVYKPLQPDTVTSIFIEGTSHCADMMREQRNDVKVLKDARKQIKRSLTKWLKRK